MVKIKIQFKKIVYQNNKEFFIFDRKYGPARYFNNNNKEYWIDGIPYTTKEYYKQLKN